MSFDWTKLVGQGRAKDIGIAWSNEELEALTTLSEKLGLTRPELAPYIRNGVLTKEDYEAAKAKEEKAGKGDDFKTRKELEADAKELGVEFTPEVSDSSLSKEIERAKARAEASATVVVNPSERTKLEAEATALGIEFGPRTKDTTLVNKIAKAKEKAAPNEPSV